MPKPEYIFDERSGKIVQNIDQLTKDLDAIQREIYQILLTDYLSQLVVDEGLLLFSNKNLAIITQLTDYFAEFSKLSDFEKNFAGQLYDITLQSKSYFFAFETLHDKVKKININPLYRVIGIDNKGAIVKDGFLSKLFSSQSELLQNDIKNYILESLANQANYTEFLKGFRQIIIGSEEKDGKLQHYYRQYAYDLHTKVARITDEYFADQLDLNYAVYSGTEMVTSRPFCKGGEDKYAGHFDNKIGKVFSREDMQKWKDIPKWEGKFPLGDEYNPITDVGGAQCHHLMRWITDELAIEMNK